MELLQISVRGATGLAARGFWLPALVCCACAARPDVASHVVVPPSAGSASSYTVPGAAQRPAPSDCPMSVEGADVVYVPLEYGGALVFTSSLASPAVLRRAVRRFVQACNSGAVRPSPAGIPTSIRYADAIAGARVEVRTEAASQLAPLERYLRWLAFDMREHRTCDAAAARRDAG
jgi:hypothetical protein